jgi:hypothetical protein
VIVDLEGEEVHEGPERQADDHVPVEDGPPLHRVHEHPDGERRLKEIEDGHLGTP